MVPYYFFWPIAVISFILVFFLPTSQKIEYLNENNKNINNSNVTDNIFLNYEKENKNISEECTNYKMNNKELKLIKSFNLSIKIIVFVLFGFVIIHIGFVIFLIKAGLCYDEDYGGYCQTWQHTFSVKFPEEKDFEYECFWMVSIIIFICLGIIILSIFSICYSSEFKSQMSLNCGYKFNKDYYIKYWNNSVCILIIIIILYSLEILFSLYSICYGIFVLRKKNEIEINESKKEKNATIIQLNAEFEVKKNEIKSEESKENKSEESKGNKSLNET